MKTLVQVLDRVTWVQNLQSFVESELIRTLVFDRFRQTQHQVGALLMLLVTAMN
jgi:hypothetical protein